MRVLIVGRAGDALAEYAAARALGSFDAIVVVGKMGEVFPDRIDYWCSFHSNLFAKWVRARAVRQLPPAARFWAALYKGRRLGEAQMAGLPTDFIPSIGGSSGFLAVEGALGMLAADRIVLAGIPLTQEGGHQAEVSEPHELGKPWGEAEVYWQTWLDNEARLMGRVRSMSGRTRELLGTPTPEWLAGAS